jgi:hypothetical protein
MAGEVHQAGHENLAWRRHADHATPTAVSDAEAAIVGFGLLFADIPSRPQLPIMVREMSLGDGIIEHVSG